MTEQEKTDFLLKLYIERMRAVGRAQALYVHVLLIYLAFVCWQALERGSALSVSIAGLSMTTKSIWPITPAVVTLLCLGLVGAVNSMGPVWRRLREVSKSIGTEIHFTDLETSSNILDYIAFLTWRPERKLQMQKPPWAEKWRIQRFLYPGLLLLGMAATWLSWSRGPIGHTYKAYVFICILAQLLFSSRIYWRALCGALNMRLEENELD